MYGAGYDAGGTPAEVQPPPLHGVPPLDAPIASPALKAPPTCASTQRLHVPPRLLQGDEAEAPRPTFFEASSPKAKKARSLGPGEVHTNIASPFFKSAKPDAARLKKEVLARDPTVRCSSFSVPRLLQVLCNLPVPVQAQPAPAMASTPRAAQAGPQAPEGGAGETGASPTAEAAPAPSPTGSSGVVGSPAAAPPPAVAAAPQPNTDGPSQRWSAKVHTVRMLHCCMLHLPDYLNRNKKLTRKQLDACSTHWAWEKIVMAFNDPAIKFSLHVPKEYDEEEMLLKLSTAWTPYVATAAKLHAEHTTFAKDLQVRLARWRLSGNGDMGELDEAAKVKYSLGTCSADFRNYCDGRPVLLYGYYLLNFYEALASAARDMPEGTGHSSTSNRRAAETIPRHLRNANAQPGQRPPQKKGKRGQRSFCLWTCV